jgi:hypothetical protein
MGGFNTSVAPPSPVALDIRPPQSQSPMEIAAQMQQLQAGRQQMQTGQMQQQALQMENQQRQLDLQDQQYMRKAWMDANGDLDQTLQNFQKLGGSPKAAFALNQQVTQMKAANEKLTSDQLANKNLKNDQLESILQPVLSESDPQKQAALWGSAVSSAVKQGLMTAEEAQQHPYPGADGVVSYAKGLETEKWLTAQAAKQRAQAAQDQAATTATKEKREAGQQQFQNAVSQLAANPPKTPQEYRQRLGALPTEVAMRFLDAVPVGAYDPAKSVDTLRQLGMTGEQQTQAAQAKTNAAQIAAHNKVEEGQGAQRIGLERQANSIRAAEADPYGQLGINPNPIRGTNAHGEEFLKTLPPTLAMKVKAVTEGRQPMPNARGGQLRGEGKALSDAVYQYDPEFSTQRAQIRNAFTTGKAADNIGALNTATVHLDQLGEIAKALANGSFRPGNSVWNSAVTMFGGAAPTNFAGLKSAVAGEMANALKGNATDPEIANISKAIDSANSPEQLAGVITTHLHTLGAKLNTYQQRYAQQIPNDKTWSPVLPAARAVYEKHGINPTEGGGNTGGGAKAYSHTATGANGHKIGSNDGKTWFDVQTGKQIQ